MIGTLPCAYYTRHKAPLCISAKCSGEVYVTNSANLAAETNYTMRNKNLTEIENPRIVNFPL